MNTNNRRSALVLGAMFTVGVSLSLYFAFFMSDWTSINNLFHLPNPLHFLVVALVIPMLGSIIVAPLMPRIIVPLFLGLKRVALRQHENAYVAIEQNRLSLRSWLGRSVLTALLILGFIAVVVQVVNPILLMSNGEYNAFLLETGFPQYAPPVMISLAGLIAPLAFGIWTASWAMEDAGLLHYYIPKGEEPQLYAVEPVHLRYKDFLRGYSGLSSLFFIASIFILFATTGGNIESAIFILLIPLFSILSTIPGYLLYSRLSKNFIRSGLPKAGRLDKSDLGILEA